MNYLTPDVTASLTYLGLAAYFLWKEFRVSHTTPDEAPTGEAATHTEETNAHNGYSLCPDCYDTLIWGGEICPGCPHCESLES